MLRQNSNPADTPSPVQSSKAKRKSNVSLPDKSLSLEVKSQKSRRNTLTEENVATTRKKSMQPTIPEDETTEPKDKKTLTEENVARPRKKSMPPTIPEDKTADTKDRKTSFINIENEKKLNRQASNASKISTASGKSISAYENKAYEGNLQRNESQNNSTRTPTRASSVQSLVYREQYCCCAKRTKCERSLLISVTVLTVIIIVLVIVIVVIAKNKKAGGELTLPNLKL